MARRKKRRKVAATQATIQTRPPVLKLAFSSGLALVLFIAMGASAQSLLKGNVTKQNETKPNKDLVDKYGDAANDPAVADVLRKAQGSLTTEEIKQKNEAYDALQNGEFKPGADPMMAVMSGYVPPNMSPQQAQILSRVLPKMPHMPHPPTPDDIARMAGETDNQGTALEPAEPYIAYPESFAKAHGLPTSRKLQPIPEKSFPGQLAGMPGMQNVPGLSNLPGMPMMGIPGHGSGFGLSEAEIRAQNQRIAEESIRGRFGPINIGQLQPGHGAIAAQAKENADTKHIAESDHQSVVGVCDDSGNEITSIQYDPYGQPTVLAGTSMPAFMYKGMYYHDRSGKYLTLYRVYDPKIGRWLSRDPLGESVGINLYAYCDNDPINRRDPLGLWVNATYSQSRHTFTGVDSETGATFNSSDIFSGNDPFTNQTWAEAIGGRGPIPQGDYFIEPKVPILGENGFEYPLNAVSPGIQEFMGIPWKSRGGFMIHPGLASNGCVTFKSKVPEGLPNYPSNPAFDALSDMLDKTSPLNVNGVPVRGILKVVP